MRNYESASDYGVVREVKLDDHREITAKPLSQDQIEANTPVNIPGDDVRAVVDMMRHNYRLGPYAVPLSTFSSRIEHYESARVWVAKRGIDLFPRIQPRITEPAHVEQLESMVDRFHNALKELNIE